MRVAFTDIFIRRPALSTAISLLILVLGLQAIFSLQIRQFPELTSTQITITTRYPGATAALMQGFVTTPLEEAVASADGIDYMTSTSQQNASTISLFLRLDADPDRALTEVLTKINEVRNILPAAADDPVVEKTVGNGRALVYFSFFSDALSNTQIVEYADRVVQPRVQRVPGVASADPFGASNTAVRIWLDPDRMAALGVTPAQVEQAIRDNNFVSAPGRVKADFIQINVDAETSLKSVAAFEKLVVSNRGDALVRLRDIARVELGPQSADALASYAGRSSVFVGVFPTPDANPLEMVDGVREVAEELRRELPPGLDFEIGYDSTRFIRAAIEEVIKTLVEAAIIVVVVIFLFIGNLRATVIPVVTIPLSLIGSMLVIQALGYSINLLTLLALVLAIGLVVDDAIVVVENITRRLEEGMDRMQAALLGAREIAMPVVAMTLTLAAAYAPIGFVGGLTGGLFREFAFTLAASVIVSGVIALVLSPMMCARILPPDGENGRFGRWLDARFRSLQDAYSRTLHGAMNTRPAILLVGAVMVAMCPFLYLTAQQELAPDEDQSLLFVAGNGPSSANVDYALVYGREIEGILKQFDEYETNFMLIGQPYPGALFGGMVLKPWDERDRSQNEVLGELLPKLGGVSGMQVFSFADPSLPGPGAGPPVQIVVKSVGDYRTLLDVVTDLQQQAMQSGLFLFTNTSLRFDNPLLTVQIDADKANSLGIRMEDIGRALSTMMGGNNTNRITLDGRSYDVIAQAPRDYRLTPDWIGRYYVASAVGELVPLSSVVTVNQVIEPSALPRFQQQNSATIQAQPFPGRSLGEAIGWFQDRAEDSLPSGFSFDYAGPSRQYIQEGQTLAMAFGFAIVVIYLVLAAQFESFRDPLIILVTVPMSVCGALIPLNLGLGTVNIYTQVGLVTLIGLISKHGILMVEFANRLQIDEGYSRREAIEKAAAVRLRPILMTTAAMVMATIPLLLAEGAGANSRYAMGLVISCGMTVGTLFTLFVVPAIYSLIAKDHRSEADEPAIDDAAAQPVQ